MNLNDGLKQLVWTLGLEENLITTAGDPYLSRFYIARHPKTRFGQLPSVYLHFFHRGDLDRELHNHPWERSWSFILWGGYREERRVGDQIVVRELRPGMWNRLDANDFHRVDLLDPRGCWSLFFAGDRVQNWGFWNRESSLYTPWEDYVDDRDKTTAMV